jgi:hypothetical protein
MNRIPYRSTLVTVGAAVLLLAACNQIDDQASVPVHPSVVVVEPVVTGSKDLVVRHSQSFEPRVTDKSATQAEVDVTGGTAELSYTIEVEDVLVAESDTTTIANLSIGNDGTNDLTVDIADTLYCGDGSGVIDLGGPLAIAVFGQDDVFIAAGGSFDIAGPFGPYDVAACPDFDGITKDVVNRIVVRDAATDAVIATIDLAPTQREAASSIFAALLVDEEVIPAGYAITDASLTSGGADVPFTATAMGDLYTIVTDGVAGAGTYQLTKTLTRDAGVDCEPDLAVLNTAFMSTDGTAEGMVGDAATASIALVCTPPGGGEGCTPGFWQNWTGAPPGLQPNAWLATGYHWADPFTSAGFVNAYNGRTFLQVLQLGGGGKNALGRHTVAALLNAAHPNVAYDLTVAEVIAKFNHVINTNGNVNALKNEFEALNEQGCPLNQALY